jgi:hypothetical protein
MTLAMFESMSYFLGYPFSVQIAPTEVKHVGYFRAIATSSRQKIIPPRDAN